jgi:hypothetical protein
MHTRNLTGHGEDPTTDGDREDKSFARRFRASPREVQQNAIEREKRSAHQNRDMES